MTVSRLERIVMLACLSQSGLRRSNLMHERTMRSFRPSSYLFLMGNIAALIGRMRRTGRFPGFSRGVLTLAIPKT
jgi:hypothetical protein